MQCAMPPWPRVPFRPDNGGRAGAVDNHDYVQDYNVNGGDDNGNNFCEA